MAFAVLAFVVAATSYRRWWRVQRAMRTGQPLPHPWLPAAMGAGLSLIIAVTVAYLFLA